MSAAADKVEKSDKAEPRGVIRDRGYKPYDGKRDERGGRASLIASRMFRMSARQPWVIVFLILAIFPSLTYAVAMWIGTKLYLMQTTFLQQSGQALPPNMELVANPDHYVLNVIAQPYGTMLVAFFIALFAGGGAVADDARAGTFQFYFARPVTREQYLVGKLVPPVALVALVAIVPSVLIAILRVALTRDASEALREIQLVPEAMALGIVEALAFGVPIVALSSLSRARGYAQGAFAAVFFLPWILGSIFVSVTRSPWPALLSVPAHLQNLGRFLFQLPIEEGDRPLPVWVSAVMIALLVSGSIALLRRRLAAVEVIAS